MKNSCQRILVLFLLISLLSSCSKLISSEQTVFYKKEFSKKLKEYQSFPVTSWNYLVVREGQELEDSTLEVIEKSFPVILHKDYYRGVDSLLKDWTYDYVFLKEAEDVESLEKNLKATITKAHFLEMFQPNAIKTLKKDPFDRSIKFFNKWGKFFNKSNLTRSDKYTFIPVLPINFIDESKAIDWSSVEEITNKKDGPKLIGPSFFERENKQIIMSDLKKVSLFGLIFFALLSIYLVIKRSYKVVFFFPIVALSVFTSLVILNILFGSVHGLVLSFGISIVGLSIDYGIHAIKHKDKKNVWKNNAYSLVTTLIAFFVLSFSSVPLFKGLAQFAFIGILISFLFMWLLDKKFSLYQENDLKSSKKDYDLKKVLIAPLFLAVLLGLSVQYNGGFSSFLYIPDSVSKIMSDLESNNQDLLVRITDIDKIKNKDSLGLTTFVGNDYEARAALNSKAWGQLLIDFDETKFNGVFSEFIRSSKDHIDRGFDVNKRLYTKLFISSENTNRTIEFFNSEVNTSNVEEYWSPKKLVSKMGDEILKECLRLFGIALLISIVFLFVAFKKITKVIYVFVPFCIFLSLFFLSRLVFNLEFNLIHLIGVIITFGISLDYGIFGVQTVESEKNGVRSAFNLSALTTFIGFAPLLLSSHPVLFHLGAVLVIGIVGLYSGGLLLLRSSFNEPQVNG